MMIDYLLYPHLREEHYCPQQETTLARVPPPPVSASGNRHLLGMMGYRQVLLTSNPDKAFFLYLSELPGVILGGAHKLSAAKVGPLDSALLLADRLTMTGSTKPSGFTTVYWNPMAVIHSVGPVWKILLGNLKYILFRLNYYTLLQRLSL